MHNSSIKVGDKVILKTGTLVGIDGDIIDASACRPEIIDAFLRSEPQRWHVHFRCWYHGHPVHGTQRADDIALVYRKQAPRVARE